MIDLHSHLLPGIDDGPATIERSVTLARAFVDAGTEVVTVTPHVSWDYPHVTSALIAERVVTLRDALRRADIPLTVLAGAEIALSRASDLDAAELDALSLGGGGWLLVEPPFSSALAGVEAAMDRLLLGGRKLVLAHPERSPGFAQDPERLRPYVNVGVICQVTSGSLTGAFGKPVQKTARRMMDAGLIGVMASDAHDVSRRVPGMADAVATLKNPQLGVLLSQDVPRAILEGAPLPELPQRDDASGGALLRRLRGR